MPCFRKRPVVIEAVRMDEPFEVETLEGTMRGKAGDYLITGVAGEQYPCDATIFEATYESVDEGGHDWRRTAETLLAEKGAERKRAEAAEALLDDDHGTAVGTV